MDSGVAVRGLDGQIGRAGRHVQQAERIEETHPPHGGPPPGDVPAEAEQMVQKIVPPGTVAKISRTMPTCSSRPMPVTGG